MYKIPMAKPIIEAPEIESVLSTLKAGWISQGPKTKEFEQIVEQTLKVRNAIAMANGTVTLHAILVAIGVRSGDEVICPSLSYISTVNAILYCGASPRFIDVEMDDFNVAAETIYRAITKKTKAIITVDLKGSPVDFNKIKSQLSGRGIFFLSDSAQSLGAVYNNQPVGSQADAHSFSMFANKNITSGEGGIITTNDDALAEKLRQIRNHGQTTTRYKHDFLGFNYRYNDVLASIAIPQIGRLSSLISEKNLLVNRYFEVLQDLDEVLLPVIKPHVTQHAWYHLCLKFATLTLRNAARDALEQNCVETRVAFPPIHTQPMMNNRYKDVFLPNTERLYECMLDIPCHPSMSNEDVDFIADIIRNAIRKN